MLPLALILGAAAIGILSVCEWPYTLFSLPPSLISAWLANEWWWKRGYWIVRRWWHNMYWEKQPIEKVRESTRKDQQKRRQQDSTRRP